MRFAIPVVATALAGCAAKTPLDLIPPEDLMMIEAAERMEAQSPDTLRTPRAEPDLAAEYRAALLAAGVAQQPDETEDSPDGAEITEDRSPPARRRASAGAAAADGQGDGGAPAAPADAPGPITVEEMLARIREQAGERR